MPGPAAGRVVPRPAVGTGRSSTPAVAATSGTTAAGRPRSRCRRAPRPRPRSGSHRPAATGCCVDPGEHRLGGAGCGAAGGTPISALVPSRSPALRRAVSQNRRCPSVNTPVARALTRAVAPANAPPAVGGGRAPPGSGPAPGSRCPLCSDRVVPGDEKPRHAGRRASQRPTRPCTRWPESRAGTE